MSIDAFLERMRRRERQIAARAGSTCVVTIPGGPGTFDHQTGGYTGAAADTVRFATHVLGFSSQYSGSSWNARQALGAPDTYPRYGDISTAWASRTGDANREYLELGYDAPIPASSSKAKR